MRCLCMKCPGVNYDDNLFHDSWALCPKIVAVTLRCGTRYVQGWEEGELEALWQLFFKTSLPRHSVAMSCLVLLG